MRFESVQRRKLYDHERGRYMKTIESGSSPKSCLVTTVLFRSPTVSTVKRVFFPFLNGRKRTFCMGERNGTVATKQALGSVYFLGSA